MILFSDVHLREQSADIVLKEVLPGIERACFQHNDMDLACLGDFYHCRYRIDVRIQNEVRSWLYKITRAGIRLRIIPGNHDQVDMSGQNALEVFDDIRHVSVYTVPTWDNSGLWVPYRKDAESIKTALNVASHDYTYDNVLFMHHGIQGAMMNNFMADTEGLPLEAVNKFRRVFCGHYHKRQVLANVTYIGSPWQTKADETNQPKGYAIWDGTDLQFVDTPWGPRYHILEMDGKTALDFSGINKRDEVRITAAKGVDFSGIAAQLEKLGVAHSITPEVVVEGARLKVSESANLIEYAQAYVDQLDTDLDRKKLMDVFGEIIA